MKPAKQKRGTTPTLADVLAWRTNWKSRGKGRDPMTHETGDGLRRPAHDPNPETPLDFN